VSRKKNSRIPSSATVEFGSVPEKPETEPSPGRHVSQEKPVAKHPAVPRLHREKTPKDD
jgi:hypothetical protein